MTFEEHKSHFTSTFLRSQQLAQALTSFVPVWALTKSHLLLGTDLTKLSPQLLQVVTNPGILAINQDSQFGQGYNFSRIPLHIRKLKSDSSRSVAPFRWTAAPNPPYVWEAPVPIFLSDIQNPAAVRSFPSLLKPELIHHCIVLERSHLQRRCRHDLEYPKHSPTNVLRPRRIALAPSRHSIQRPRFIHRSRQRNRTNLSCGLCCAAWMHRFAVDGEWG